MKRKGHKPVIAFLTLILGMSSTSLAYDIVVPNEDRIDIYYSWYNYDKTELYVSEVTYDFSKLESGRLIIPSNVLYHGTMRKVTLIGAGAFQKCNMKSIDIPNSVTKIGQFAFYSCEELTDVRIPNSVKSIGGYAFYHCQKLTSVTISNSVNSIGTHAFKDCKNLTNVFIPNSVNTIGKGAFQYCENLRKVVIEGSPVIKEDAFYFYGSGSLDTIVLRSQTPPKMYLGNANPFYKGYPFTEHTFENAVLLIPKGTYDTYAASELWSRFKHICTPIENESKSVLENDSITINNNDEERYESDFEKDSIYYTFQVDGVYVAARNIRERKDYSGDGPLTPRDPQSGGQQPRVPIRTRAQETASDSLDYMPYRGNIVIPESVSVFDTTYSVTGIKYLAFQGCNELESVTIPNSVKQIGYAGFAECTGLTEITIPAGVELIDKYAFAYCSNLKRVIIEGNPVIDETAFLGCGTELEVIMAGEKGDDEMDPDDERLDPFPLSEGTIHYGIDGRRIKADTPGLHLIKRRDGSVVKALVR